MEAGLTARPHGSYGIDAPWVPLLWLAIAAATAAAAIGCALWAPEGWAVVLCVYFGACTAVYLLGACLYGYASLRGKFVIWSRLLDDVPAPASAVDLGCGRGAVAIMIALRFPRADVAGVDIWRSADQSGNSERAALSNVAANGVRERVRLLTADMTSLPIADASVDLVTAGLSVHNIPSAEGRARALQEAVRILRPGGRLIVVDIRRTREYARVLSETGAVVDGPTALGWRSWWTGPWVAARAVRARR